MHETIFKEDTTIATQLANLGDLTQVFHKLCNLVVELYYFTCKWCLAA